MKLQNWPLFILVVFLWGTNWTAMKVGLEYAPPTTFVLHRFLVSSAALSPFMFILWKKIPRDIKTIGKLMLYCLLAVTQVTMSNIGLVHENSGIGSVLTFTQPFFVFALAVMFLKEKIRISALLGASLGLAGVSVLALNKMTSLTISSTLILVFGAFLMAVMIVYYKRFLSYVDPFVASFTQMAVGALPLIVLNMITNNLAFPTELTYVGIILYSSIGSLAIGTVVWLFLLKREEATVISSSSFLIPLVALFSGWQLLGEHIYLESIFGSALVLGGVFLVNLRISNRTPAAVDVERK